MAAEEEWFKVPKEVGPYEVSKPQLEAQVKQLTEKNYEQASMIMSRDHEMRMLNKFLEEKGLTLVHKNWREEQTKQARAVIESLMEKK